MALRRNRDFVLLQAGQLFSSAGSSLSGVAYPLVVLSLTHSPPKAGFVAFARILPSPLFGLAAGVVADRVDRRVIMLAADVGRALALATLALVVAFHPLYWPIPLLAFVEGTGDAFFGASAPGATRAVVPAPQLPAAVSVQHARSAAVGVAGPPLGGALFGLGRALPFLVDSVSYVFSFAALLAMRTPFQQTREHGALHLRAQLGEGFRFLWGQPFLRTTSFLYAVGNFTIPAYLFVLVVVGRRHALSGGEIGVLLAVFSAFVFLGTLLSPAARSRLSVRGIVLLELYAGLGALAYVAWPSVYVLAIGLLPQAVVLPITDSVVIGRRLAMTPDRLLGRVEAVRTTLARTAQPLGPLVAGVLLGAVSVRATVAIFGVLTAGLAVCGTASRALRAPPALVEVV
jgi:Transmembrane secretion effector